MIDSLGLDGFRFCIFDFLFIARANHPPIDCGLDRVTGPESIKLFIVSTPLLIFDGLDLLFLLGRRRYFDCALS
jgi:hypothetical protein